MNWSAKDKDNERRIERWQLNEQEYSFKCLPREQGLMVMRGYEENAPEWARGGKGKIGRAPEGRWAV